jgi:hypothetical protein
MLSVGMSPVQWTDRPPPGQGPGVLAICPIRGVVADSVEQARTFGIMRFPTPHDHGGSPCLPTPSSPRSIPPGLTQLHDAGPLQAAEPPYLLAYLATIPDPRAGAGRRHPLVAILALAAAAVLAGGGRLPPLPSGPPTPPSRSGPRSAPAAMRPVAARWSPLRPLSAARSAGLTPTSWPPRSAPGSATATCMTAPPRTSSSGHGSGRWRSTARPCARHTRREPPEGYQVTPALQL